MFLTSFASLSVLLLFPLSVTFFVLCTVFDSILSNTDEILSINPSANMFVFGDFNVRHNDWLTHSGGTDRPGELFYDFSISNDLVWIVKFPTRIPDCDSHSPALFNLFPSTGTSICFTMVFPPLRSSDHVVVSVSIDFPTNSKQDTPFHHIAYDYSRTDWDGLPDHLRDVPWKIYLKSVLLLLLLNFVSAFKLELICLSLIVRIRSNPIHLHGFLLLMLLP